MPLTFGDTAYHLPQMDALIRHFCHCDPDALDDQTWAARWRDAQFLMKLLKPLSL